jgi:hypothetical protein
MVLTALGAGGLAPPASDPAALPSGADGGTPAGAMKWYVLGLNHHEGVRLADVVAVAHPDDARFAGDHDALNAAVARLRTASTARFGADPVRTLARGALAVPTPEELRRQFARMDADLPQGVEGEAVDVGPAAREFYASGAVRGRDGRWRVSLVPGLTRPDIVRAEAGDLRAYARAVRGLADDVAGGRVATVPQLEEAFADANRARGESRDAAAAALRGGARVVRWDFREGDVLRYRTIEGSRTPFPGSDPPIEVRTEVTLDTKWEVLQVDGAGAATVAVSVERAAFSGETTGAPGGGARRFSADGDGPAPKGPAPDGIQTFLTALRRGHVTVTVDPHGVVRSVRWPEAMRLAIESPEVAELADGGGLGEQSVFSLPGAAWRLTAPLLPLPPDAVVAGSAWSATGDALPQDKLEAAYRCESVKPGLPRGARDGPEMNVTWSARFVRGAAEGAKQEHGAGTARFDLARGRVQSTSFQIRHGLTDLSRTVELVPADAAGPAPGR